MEAHSADKCALPARSLLKPGFHGLLREVGFLHSRKT